MKASIFAILAFLVAGAQSLKHAIEVQPDTCTVYGFDVDVFESFQLFVDVSRYACSSKENLMLMSKAFYAGECVVYAEEEGCLAGPVDYPSESICDYWEDAHHVPFKGNVNDTLMFVGGGQTCMTKQRYSFAFRSDCDTSGIVEFKVDTASLNRENRELCIVKKSSVPLLVTLVILGTGLLLCILGVVVCCVCCACCPGSKKKPAIEPLSSFKDLLLASKDGFDEV